MKKVIVVLWILLFVTGVGAWLYLTPPGLLGKADAIGYAVCARDPAHSFFLGARQMPLCARCTGMHMGLLLTLVALWATAPKRRGMPKKGILAVLAFFAIAFAVDGLNSLISAGLAFPWLYRPSNTARLFTGLGMGIAMGLILYPIANQVLWDYSDPREVVGWREFVVLVVGGIFVGLLILTANPLVLLPVALLSVTDVALVLTLVYALLFLTLTHHEAQAQKWKGLGGALAVGLTLAFLQIGLLDLWRFVLTGTWGFVLPK